MPIIIDGHNLIPKIPGINLSDLDDEMRLVEILQEYARLRRIKQIECFFDNAPSGHPRQRKFGTVLVQFARPGTTADSEIEDRLKRLGRQARNWTVVSSDQQVRWAARNAGSRDTSSEDFSAELQNIFSQQEDSSTGDFDPHVGKEEVDMWLEMFKSTRPNKKDRS